MGNYVVMFQKCQLIINVWKYVVKMLSKALRVDNALPPEFLLLADDSGIRLSVQQEKILMAALTAFKKTILRRDGLNQKFTSCLALLFISFYFIFEIFESENVPQLDFVRQHLKQLIIGRLLQFVLKI